MNRLKEFERFSFVLNRDGFRAALNFSLQSIRQYRKAALTTPSSEYRKKYIESYLSFKYLYAHCTQPKGAIDV